MFRGWVKKYNDLALRDSEKGAVGCDEASLRIVNDVCQEWKEIVEEYCMTRGVIKVQGSVNTFSLIKVIINLLFGLTKSSFVKIEHTSYARHSIKLIESIISQHF